jgi:prepilin-type N-terminal cleavage/methylation domain-containing protein/prepilin-type processing-associated H-X9-DG protein
MPSDHSRSTPNPSKHAFTLVELLVVIGIIAVLISILLPALGRVRSQAQATVCQANLRQFGQAFIMYADANKGFLPFDGQDGEAGDPILGVSNAPISTDLRGWDTESLWFNALPKYMGSKPYNERYVEWQTGNGSIPGPGIRDVNVCPAADVAIGRPGETVEEGYFVNFGRTAASNAVVPRRTFFSYVYNSKLLDGTGLQADRGKLSKLRPAAHVVIFVERRMNPGEVSVKDDAYYTSQGGQNNRITSRTVGRLKADWQRFTSRHNGGGHLLFADGHVGYFTMKDVLTSSTGNQGVNSDWNQPGKMIWNIYGRAGR